MRPQLLIVLVSLMIGVPVAGQSKASIQGAWRVAETVGGRGASTPTTTNSSPQPGLYLFTARHYSLTRVVGDRPRTAPKDPNKPSVAELQENYRFAAQAGTYQIKGDTITFNRTAALSIANMTTTATATSTFKLEGSTLWLTSKNADGAPSTVKLTRVE